MKKLYSLAILLFLALPQANAQVYGCTDPLSNNYNPNATVNNGTCTYSSASVTPLSSVNLPDAVDESSGLVLWNGQLYTHNDDTDINLYRIDAATGAITQTLPVTGTSNQDWEDIDQDANYIYIGDFGNNSNGNRTNLRVIRVDKSGLLNGNPTINSINFSYSNQTNFAATGNNNTDFDCEAFIVGTNNIYLFTKQWVSQKTSVYSLPKTPGTHTAQLLATYDVDGLITGATYLEDQNLVVLCGYSTLLSPFMYLLYDYAGQDFFGGNKRKVSVNEAFHQIEGIATNNGIDFYLSNEHFQQSPFVNTVQALHHVDLSAYLSQYLAVKNVALQNALVIYPNPATDTLNIKINNSFINRQFAIIDMTGKEMLTGNLSALDNKIDIGALATGLYTVVIKGYGSRAYKLVKK